MIFYWENIYIAVLFIMSNILGELTIAHLIGFLEILILFGIVFSRSKWNFKVMTMVVIVSTFVVLIVLSYNYILHRLTQLPMPASAGEFGDQFGALTCFFTGMGIIGVLLTLVYQHQTLKQMRADSIGQRKQAERHWFFTIIPAAEERWSEEYQKRNGKEESCHDRVQKIVKRLCATRDSETIKDAWNIASSARCSFLHYNIVPYNLNVTNLFEEEEKKDIIAETFMLFSPELQFCLLLLYLSGVLPRQFRCMEDLVTKEQFKIIMLQISPKCRNQNNIEEEIISRGVELCSGRVITPDTLRRGGS